MTPTQREAALRLADNMDLSLEAWMDQAATMLRELAAEPPADPVAWMHDGFVSTNFERVKHDESRNRASGFKAKPIIPLYTAPAQDTRACTCHPDDNPPTPCPRKYALGECREAAKAAPVQEPVATLHDDGYWTPKQSEAGRRLNDQLMHAGTRVDVYAHPPQQRKPLTDDEALALIRATPQEDVTQEGWIRRQRLSWVRAIEHMHGITGEPT